MPCRSGSPLIPHRSPQRKQSIAQVGGLAGNFRPLTDSLRHIWIFYVVGYDGDRQDRLIYGPMRTIANEIKTQYCEDRLAAPAMVCADLSFREHQLVHQSQGFLRLVLRLASFRRCGERSVYRLIYASAALAARADPDAASLLRPAPCSTGGSTQMLAQIELERLPTETQGEFARRAQEVISARGPERDSVSDVPREVVDAFYQIRFGHLELEPESLEAH